MKLISLVTIMALFSCRGERWDDDLTLPEQPYTGNQMQIDGYFFNESDGRRQVYVFYRNGVVLDGGSPLTSALAIFEEELSNGTYYNFAKDKKYKWGRFLVDSNVLQFELWKPNTGPFEAYTYEGVILNDTTFKLTKSWRSCKPKKVNEFEETFHFKRFSPKPDSTNTFTD
jgi:hypothetical protein